MPSVEGHGAERADMVVSTALFSTVGRAKRDALGISDSGRAFDAAMRKPQPDMARPVVILCLIVRA
jgi:hypothetical protein